MALTLGSLPLLLVPALNMITATILEFVVVGQVAKHMQIAAFVPSVMMTMTLAISFDYSLFVCSRYLEARKAGVKDETKRVRAVLRGAGHTIVVSGSTLIACFLGLLCFPNAMLRGVGAAISIGLACAMVVNLTLSPALLHAGGERLCAAQDRAFAKLRNAWRGLAASPARDDDYALFVQADDDEADRPAPRPNPWRFAARKIWDDRRLAACVIVAVAAIAAPACAHALKITQIADPVMVAPSPSEPEKILNSLGDTFGAGAIAPYTVLFDVPAGLVEDADAALDVMDDFLRRGRAGSFSPLICPSKSFALSFKRTTPAGRRRENHRRQSADAAKVVANGLRFPAGTASSRAWARSSRSSGPRGWRASSSPPRTTRRVSEGRRPGVCRYRDPEREIFLSEESYTTVAAAPRTRHVVAAAPPRLCWKTSAE